MFGRSQKSQRSEGHTSASNKLKREQLKKAKRGSRKFASNSPQDSKKNAIVERKGLKATKDSNINTLVVKALTVPQEIEEIKEDHPKAKVTRETEGINSRRTMRQVLQNHF